jgi:molybdenum cofactor guanylyltransferase
VRVGRPGIVVIAGGQGRRAGGADKAVLDLYGRPLLAHVLDAALGLADPAVVVGPVRLGFTGVTWTLEEPPGSGPLAALAAGVAALPSGCDPVLVLGGDMPYVARGVPALLAALRSADIAVLVDASGHEQPLASGWRRAALVAALASVGPSQGVGLKRLFDGRTVTRVVDTQSATVDVDTLEDLRRLGGAP